MYACIKPLSISWDKKVGNAPVDSVLVALLIRRGYSVWPIQFQAVAGYDPQLRLRKFAQSD